MFDGLEQAMQAWRPDVVQLTGDSVTFLARAATIVAAYSPRVVLYSGTVSPVHRADFLASRVHRRRLPMSRAMLRELVHRPTIPFLVNSDIGLETHREWLDGLGPTSAVLPNLMPVARFRRDAEVPITTPWPDGVPVVGGLFRVREVKRPLLWLEVARRVGRERPDVHFVIVGSGPMDDEVAAAGADLPNLHLVGEQVPAPWVRTFSTMLLTSSAEGFPNVCLEAQVLGVPVVAPDVGGTAQTFIPGTTGFLVTDLDDPGAYADAVLASLDPTWRASAGPSAARHVDERFGPERQLEILLPRYGLDPRAFPLDRAAWDRGGPSMSSGAG
jgi:glycosyltransferase involved in cell wall biosynthesis